MTQHRVCTIECFFVYKTSTGQPDIVLKQRQGQINGTITCRCAGRLFFDLLNEPDSWNMAWSQEMMNPNAQTAASSIVPAWGTLFTNTAAQLIAQEPALLFFAEGCGQRNQPGTSYGLSYPLSLCIPTTPPSPFPHQTNAVFIVLFYCV